MYTNVRLWKKIRNRILTLGESRRFVAEDERISRTTVKKMLLHELPPGYSNAKRHPKIAAQEAPATPARRNGSAAAKQRWMEWLYEIERQPTYATKSVALPPKLSDALAPPQTKLRRKVLSVLAKEAGFSITSIAHHLGIERKTVRGYLDIVRAGDHQPILTKRKRKPKPDTSAFEDAVYALLHEPPSLSGFNRTTWRLADLKIALADKGFYRCCDTIRLVVKKAGFRWRSARVVLTSTDPDYRKKLEHIQAILSSLKEDERFFSIDEFGPFAVKMKAGRQLVATGVQPTVPQWQKSKGCLILTAALELSTNQITHFYSKAKNTTEMIRMANALIDEYKGMKKLYLSWDAASWHMSKELLAFVTEHNSCRGGTSPELELAPLPASAQFLNVIESVFSGMARAIIHNSDYQSSDAAIAAIDRYFEERNKHYQDNPKRAGKKIWGQERTSVTFSPSNNCKDPAYSYII